MNKNIVVLEDNKDISELIKFLLVKEEHSVETYASVQSFWNGIKGKSIDLFILDVMLPDGNGFSVCKTLKSTAETKHTPIMLMSANLNSHGFGSEWNAQDFIQKPFDIDNFVARVSFLLLS
ncbi:MAG: response regulator transcription factor [Chitinophagaceae bacterium]|nr:MAG: response regulator transcription factor [Chitinophagaceae bacterium]